MKNNPYFGYIVSFLNEKSYWIFDLISDFRKETHPKLIRFQTKDANLLFDVARYRFYGRFKLKT